MLLNIVALVYVAHIGDFELLLYLTGSLSLFSLFQRGLLTELTSQNRMS